MGPTASGKSALAMALAKHIDYELISVDSAMVYRGMDIGTAKPTAEERAQVVHHLLDIRDPAQSYSAGQFRADAIRLIEAIIAKGKAPILVGGTMLYFHVLQHGLAELPIADSALRQRLTAEAQQIGWEAMHKRLQQIDPIAAQRIKPTDPQRISRALEVYELMGKTLTQLCQESQKQEFSGNFVNIALMPELRSSLHEQIEQRFDNMLQCGFIDEVEQLYARPDLHKELPAIRSVGYRQAWDYLAGEIDKDEMRLRAIAATRQLAKRQITWLRSWEGLHYYTTSDGNLLDKVLRLLQ